MINRHPVPASRIRVPHLTVTVEVKAWHDMLYRRVTCSQVLDRRGDMILRQLGETAHPNGWLNYGELVGIAGETPDLLSPEGGVLEAPGGLLWTPHVGSHRPRQDASVVPFDGPASR